MPMRKHCFIATALLLLAACDDGTDWASAGYQDGYASIFNTACKIRVTMIHGKWENSKYSEGYARGASAAAADVANKGCRS